MSTNLFKYIQGVLGDHMCVLTRASRLYLTILNAVLNVVFIFKNTITQRTLLLFQDVMTSLSLEEFKQFPNSHLVALW